MFSKCCFFLYRIQTTNMTGFVFYLPITKVHWEVNLYTASITMSLWYNKVRDLMPIHWILDSHHDETDKNLGLESFWKNCIAGELS
jgi:hypothetical protein